MRTIHLSELPELEGKQFDTIDALKNAEAKVLEQRKEKIDSKTAKKEAAAKVEEALKAQKDASKKFLEAKRKALEAYNKAIAGAKTEYLKVEKSLNEAIDEFTSKYGYFHTSYKSGDEYPKVILDDEQTAELDLSRELDMMSKFISSLFEF